MADVATNVRCFISSLEPKVPREQILIMDEEFQLVFIFLAGKTREFRVSSLCLHVFLTAVLTSSKALRCLTSSSLGSK